MVPLCSRSALPSPMPSISASENAPWPQAGDSCESSAPCEAAKVMRPFSVLEKSLTRLATSTPPRDEAARRDRAVGVASIEEQHRLARDGAHFTADILLRDCSRDEAFWRGVGGQEPVVAFFVGETMAGDENHADVAAGYGRIEPFERIEHIGARRVPVDESAHLDIRIKPALLLLQRVRE